MNRRIWLIADDFGLAPGVTGAILDLLGAERISGTSCMTVFPEWQDDAALLRPHFGQALIGLHLTLTDQLALTGPSNLAPDGRLPSFAGLVFAGRTDSRSIQAELTAQYDRFADTLGAVPDFVDGHQHVHFLPVARDWLRSRFPRGAAGRRPRLRGSPLAPATADASARKIAMIAALAIRFDSTMRQAGFQIMGPLAGIYDWRRPNGFETVLQCAIRKLPDDGLFMCHPGKIDNVLKARDQMLDARPLELRFMRSDRFTEMLARAGVSIARQAP